MPHSRPMHLDLAAFAVHRAGATIAKELERAFRCARVRPARRALSTRVTGPTRCQPSLETVERR